MKTNSKQFKDALAEFSFDHYSQKSFCAICGNAGMLDTRGKVHTVAGVECGAFLWCICPNGGTWREHCQSDGPTQEQWDFMAKYRAATPLVASSAMAAGNDIASEVKRRLQTWAPERHNEGPYAEWLVLQEMYAEAANALAAILAALKRSSMDAEALEGESDCDRAVRLVKEAMEDRDDIRRGDRGYLI